MLFTFQRKRMRTRPERMRQIDGKIEADRLRLAGRRSSNLEFTIW